MYKQKSPNKKKSNIFTSYSCIKCGCDFYKTDNSNDVMCPNCKIQDSVDRMTRRIKFQ